MNAGLRATVAAGALAAIALAQGEPGLAPTPTPAPAPTQPAASSNGDAAPAAAATDWSKEVARACTSPRYGLRLAASKKVAAGGDAAVAAVRAYGKEHGADALPVALIEAIADGGGDGEAVQTLLSEWAQDRDFFWRAQAMKGLARRSADAALAQRYRDLFARMAADPAWLMRSYARCGLLHAAPPGDRSDPLADDDPRAATRLAATVDSATLLGAADTRLVAALGDERTFLGDPWGRRRATEAFQALQRRHGKDWGFKPEATFASNEQALAAIARDLHTEPPPHLTDPDLPIVGGIEVMSCRNGDLFVEWTADGRVAGGVTPALGATLQLEGKRWRQLSAAATALALPPQSGVVICDKLRIVPGAAAAQAAVAPGALPAAAAEWLKQFAAAIEEAGGTDLCRALRDRLPQFTVR